MAIKTVDIADAGVVERIRSNMAVVTDSAKGLFPSNDYNVGPRRYNLLPKNLIEIGDTTGIWNRNFFWCIATLFRSAIEVFFCSTRNSEANTYGYAVKRVIAYEKDFLKIYKNGDKIYLYNTSITDTANLIFFSLKGIKLVGEYETLDSTYEEVAMTEIQ